MGVIFVSGAYGVGKTTLCEMLSNKKGIPHYSASDIISQATSETYGSNKIVKNVKNNQDILIESVSSLLKKNNDILLSGHFCIFDKKSEVIKLPEFV